MPQLHLDRALGARPELSLKKSPFARQKLETKQTAGDSDRPPHPQLTQNISDSDQRQSHTQLTQNISDSDQRRSTSIPNSPPAAALPSIPTTPIPKVGEIEQPSTSAQGLLRPSVPSFRGTDDDDTVQISQSVVQVTGVRLNPTASGLEVILETPSGQVLPATTRIEGKSAISDIENAQLALPSGEEFSASNPDEGIAQVTVTQLEGSRIRVSVTGVKEAPTSEAIKSDRGLVLGVTPSAEEEIQITVTARQETSYRVPNASTATRTDTPLRDIPQSIQVIPRQLLEDRQITRVEEAADNLAGAAEHQFGLWNSYQLQEGSLRGLGFGLGLYYASDRAAVLPNTDVDLPSYFFRYLRSQKL